MLVVWGRSPVVLVCFLWRKSWVFGYLSENVCSSTHLVHPHSRKHWRVEIVVLFICIRSNWNVVKMVGCLWCMGPKQSRSYLPLYIWFTLSSQPFTVASNKIPPLSSAISSAQHGCRVAQIWKGCVRLCIVRLIPHYCCFSHLRNTVTLGALFCFGLFAI